MGLFTGLRSGRESILGHSIAISATSDNLANASTPGYKHQRAEFSNIIAENLGSLYGGSHAVGSGSSVTSLTTRHDVQGVLDFTNRELDFAITGKGFFVVNNGTDDLYTRSGVFTTDTEGNLVTNDGELLQGFTSDSPDTLTNLNINDVALTPTPTSEISISGNIDIGTEQGDALLDPESFTQLNNASVFSQGLEIVDSLGETKEVALHFFHTGPLDWTAALFAEGADVQGGVEGEPRLLGSVEFSVDTTGVQPEGSTTAVPMNAVQFSNGSAVQTASIDISTLTSFATASAFNNITSNGIVPGQPQGIELNDDGVLVARLASGTFAEIGTVAIANFANEGALQRLGAAKFRGTDAAGEVDIGTPNDAGRGGVESGALEISTVDPSNEVIDVIRYQRAFQAGSTVVRTMAELLDETIQIA